MTIPKSTTESYLRVNVASMNMLFDTREPDIVPPQRARAMAQAAMVSDIEARLGGPLDAFGVQELHVSKDGYHAPRHMLANTSAHTGLWQNHSRKKRGEHIAMFGQKFDHIEAIKLSDSKHAIGARIGPIGLLTVHMTSRRRDRRAIEMAAALEYLADFEYAAMFGDFNEEDLPFSNRRNLKREGYTSAFVARHGFSPITFPAPMANNVKKWEQAGLMLLGGGLRLDDIYTKGITVEDAGTIDPPVIDGAATSDHRGVYAALRTPYGVT